MGGGDGGALSGSTLLGRKSLLTHTDTLCSKPTLLCLDEPAAGLNRNESAALNKLLRNICDTYGIGILLIEHDMSVVMNISDHIVVLDYGKKISDGSPVSVRHDPRVIRAYLGEEADCDPGAVEPGLSC